MAQFRGTLSGQRGEASRLGTKRSGLTVKANGWDTGATVHIDHRDGRDHVTVLRTGGSHGGPEQVIAEWDEDGPAAFGPDEKQEPSPAAFFYRPAVRS